MPRRTLLLVLATAAGCVSFNPFHDASRRRRAPLPVTALASPHGLTWDTNADGDSTVRRIEEDAPREAVSLRTVRIRPVMPPKTPAQRPSAANPR